MALSTTNLTLAQQKQVLAYIAETAASKSLTAQQIAELSIDQKQALINAGLITQEQIETGATLELSKAQLQKIITSDAILTKDKQLILSAFGVTDANLKEASSWKILGKSMLGTLKSLATNPLTWITTGLLVTAGIFELLTESSEELRESYDETKQQIQDSESEISSLESKIKENTDAINKMKEAGASDVAIQKYEEENESLKTQLGIVKDINKALNEKLPSDVSKIVNNEGKSTLFYDALGAIMSFDIDEIIDTWSRNGIIGAFNFSDNNKHMSWKDRFGQFFAGTNPMGALINFVVPRSDPNDDILLSTESYIEEIKGYQEELNNLDKSDFDSYDDYVEGVTEIGRKIADAEGSLGTNLKTLLEYRDILANSSNPKLYQEEIDKINMLIELYASLDPSRAIDYVFSKTEFSDIGDSIYGLRENGELTGEVIQDLIPKGGDLYNKLVELGVISADDAEWFNALAFEINGVGTEAETIGGNVDEMTVSLDELKTASDDISAISSAFKELSDDGYISIETISKLQEATELSGDEWENYKTKLLNAKAGSAEFNQIMSDMTYKILDTTFKKEGFVDATEDEIVAVLRENGVLNAEAVAHEYVANNIDSHTGSIVALSIQESIAAGSISNFIQNLSNEADRIGVTDTALANLISTQIIFNNTNLDVSQKLKALQDLAAQAGLTASALMAATFTKDDKDYNNFIRRKTNLGTSVEDAQNAYLSYLWEQVDIDTPSVTPVYTPPGGGGGGDDGGSDKNEALENYLKYIEHKKALGEYDKNTQQYVNDLQWALNNLVKTQEEQWDLEEKIYDAKETLRSEEVSGYEAWMTHLESLGHYEDDIAKKINDITWALKNQSLTEEEKWEREEEIYKLTLERNEKIRESYENLAKSHSEMYNIPLSEREKFIKELEHQKALTSDSRTIKAIDRLIINSMTSGITDAQNAISKLVVDADYWKGEIAKKLEELGVSFDVSKWFDSEGNLTALFESNMDSLNNIQAVDAISSWAEIVSEKLKGVATNTEQVMQFQEDIFNASRESIEESIDVIQEAVEEIFDLRTSKFNSQLTLLQAEHNLINSIAETQHQLNKDILEAETVGARLTERERELLFTREEYNTLTDKLNDVLEDANDIQDEFNKKLKGATLDTIDQITNHYERQYELKMKEYEVVQKELDVVKAQQKLENVENEKSVRQWDGEKWIYTAVLQDVINAQKELADAEYELARTKIEQTQNEAVQEIEAKVDSIETQRNLFITSLEELTNGTNSAREKISAALTDIANTDIPMFRSIIDSVGTILKNLGTAVSLTSNLKSSDSNYSSSDGIHPVDANKAAIIQAKKSGAGFAKGAKSTSRGVALYDEDGLGSEVLITSNGVLRQFESGETVFNSEMVQRLWDFANENPINWNVPSKNFIHLLESNNKSDTPATIYDNRIYFNDVEVSDTNGIRIMKDFANYLISKT